MWILSFYNTNLSRKLIKININYNECHNAISESRFIGKWFPRRSIIVFIRIVSLYKCWRKIGLLITLLLVDVMVLKTYSNTDSSPTSSTAWWDSVSLDGSKCRRVGDGGCKSLWFSILTPTLRLSVSPLLHVGPSHVHFCQMDPGNSWTLGTALQTPISFALTWHDIQIHFFLWFFLSLQEMSHAYPCANYQWWTPADIT